MLCLTMMGGTVRPLTTGHYYDYRRRRDSEGGCVMVEEEEITGKLSESRYCEGVNKAISIRLDAGEVGQEGTV